MRILYILTSLGVGGAEKLVLALADRMTARGHTVALLVLRPQLEQELPARPAVFRLGMRKTLWSGIAALLRARRVLRSFRPEVVHSHGIHGNLFARLLRILRMGPAPIATIHNIYEGGWARMLAYRLTDRWCRMTTAVSCAAAERFVRLKAVAPAKSLAIPNGVDAKEFAPDAARRREMRASAGLAGEFLWLAAGRITPAKDFATLLRAFAIVGTQCPSAWLWIAGEAVDGAETGRIIRLAADLRIGDRIRCLGLRSDMPALLDAADGFVLSSAWEGMPLVVAEAMAMEKPVVATDVGGVRELLDECGTLVPARDSQALAGAMLHTMRLTKEQRSEQGRAARARIAERFSIDALADAWESLYRRCL